MIASSTLGWTLVYAIASSTVSTAQVFWPVLALVGGILLTMGIVGIILRIFGVDTDDTEIDPPVVWG